jgi:ADP-ribosylglycohydrolase
LTLLRLCEFEPLSALHLTLDFGHDTDSYAQVLGALAGAVHGMDIWNKETSTAVESRLAADYGETIDDWIDILAESATNWTDPTKS